MEVKRMSYVVLCCIEFPMLYYQKEWDELKNDCPGVKGAPDFS